MSTPAPERHSWGDKHSGRFDFLAGGGELGELIRRHDWAATPLGPPESWSPSLKMMVSFMLANRFPLLLWWGPRYVQLYNDHYRPVLGTKHPASLGQPCSECWFEIWQVLKPLIDMPFQGGPPTWLEDFEVEPHRHGFTEESHFTIAYSPVPDETAPHGIGGVLATVHEITEKVIAERRIAALRELGSRFAETKTEEETCSAAAEMLGKCPKDVPFALIYLIDGAGKIARRVGVTGFPVLEAAGASTVLLAGDIEQECPWPIAEVARTGTSLTVTGLVGRLAHVPPGPWSDPPNSAVVLPIRSNKAQGLAGVLVAGVSARLKLNEHYYSFFELVAAQIATAIANARAYEEERRRAEALAEIDRVKTTFFSNVSHEFRTPLTLMLGPLEEAAAHAATPEPVRKQLDLAYRNSLRLLRLVNSLLDFSRIEAGRVKASYEPTDLATLTRNLCSNFRSAMERAGLSFIVECESLTEQVYVDQDMWEKIVLNLLSNAFKFTLQGTVAVRLQRDDSQALLEVCDTGVGIPEHELPRLFERFHRVEGTLGRTQEGSGIGLALVQELVKLHGGTIETTSQLGQGTRFSVRIPFGAAHLPAAQIKASRSGNWTAIGARAFVEEALRWIPGSNDGSTLAVSAEHATRLSAGLYAKTVGKRVLLADDNADMRAYVRDLLAPIYAVETVSDGEQALEAARREHPDLILSDIMMPRLNGMALLQAVRCDDSLRDVPVILLSARAGEEARVEGLRAGADDYLVKPFSARELQARVGALIELTSMRRENEARFRAFVSATSDVVYQMSPDWSEMRHLQGRNFIADTTDPSRSWMDKYIDPDDQAQVVAAINDAIRTKSTFQLEHRVRRLDGTLGWILSRAVPLEDERGNIIEWFGTASDVTERKQAEEALSEADRRKDEFLAMLAHELRNPLAPIGNASEFLTKVLADDARTQSAVEVIKRQTRQLTRLVDDLLDVSRITQGRIKLSRQPIEVAAVIAQAVETVEPLLRAKQHKLSIVSSYGTLHVDGDFTRLVQCVGNILTNAAKYTEARGEIRVQTRSEGASVVIEISDNGAGIPARLLPRVFDLFVQSDRTLDRAQGGLGVGLAVVKRLVQMHSGEVVARSAGEGLGSAFEIRLPQIARPDGPAAETVPVKVPPRRLLIVDDNSDAANSLALLLSLQGHVTEVTYGAKDALDRIEHFKPDVALLDLGLPGVDGYELARKIRTLTGLPNIRLIAISGYGQAEDRRRTQAAGFDDHLVKPVDLAILERSLTGASEIVPYATGSGGSAGGSRDAAVIT